MKIYLKEKAMPNYCDFRLRGNGPVQYMEEFTAHWEGMLRDAKGEPDPNGFTTRILDYRIEYPEIPESDFVPYYDSAYMGCRIETGLVVIDAISNGGPPISLLCAMSSRWPDLEFVLQCTVEHELHERWHFKVGEVAIIDLWVTNIQAHEDDEPERWFVRDGKLLFWPDWHTIQWKEEVYTQRIPEWAFIPETTEVADLMLMQEAAERIVGDFESFMLEANSAEAIEDKSRTSASQSCASDDKR